MYFSLSPFSYHLVAVVTSLVAVVISPCRRVIAGQSSVILGLVHVIQRSIAAACQVALISEEVAGKQQTLREIAAHIADVVVARAAAGKHYGVVLLPEGLIESVAELGPVIGAVVCVVCVLWTTCVCVCVVDSTCVWW